MYFSGVEIPDAVLVIDGRSKQTTLLFTMSERGPKGEGLPVDLVTDAREFTGIEQVAPTDQLARPSCRGSPARDTSSTRPSSPRSSCARSRPRSSGTLQRAMTFNLWDGRAAPRAPVRQAPPGALPGDRGQGLLAGDLGPPDDQVAGRDRPAPPGRPDRRQGHDGDHAGHPSRDGGVGGGRPVRVRLQEGGGPGPRLPHHHQLGREPPLSPLLQARPDPARRRLPRRRRRARSRLLRRGYLHLLSRQREIHAAPARDLRSRPGHAGDERRALPARRDLTPKSPQRPGPPSRRAASTWTDLSSSPAACATGAATTWAWRSTTSAARPGGP